VLCFSFTFISTLTIAFLYVTRFAANVHPARETYSQLQTMDVYERDAVFEAGSSSHGVRVLTHLGNNRNSHHYNNNNGNYNNNGGNNNGNHNWGYISTSDADSVVDVSEDEA